MKQVETGDDTKAIAALRNDPDLYGRTPIPTSGAAASVRRAEWWPKAMASFRAAAAGLRRRQSGAAELARLAGSGAGGRNALGEASVPVVDDGEHEPKRPGAAVTALTAAGGFARTLMVLGPTPAPACAFAGRRRACDALAALDAQAAAGRAAAATAGG